MDITNTRSEHPEGNQPEAAHVCEWCDNWGFVIVAKRLDLSDGTNGETVDCGCRCHKDDSRGCNDASDLRSEEDY